MTVLLSYIKKPDYFNFTEKYSKCLVTIIFIFFCKFIFIVYKDKTSKLNHFLPGLLDDHVKSAWVMAKSIKLTKFILFIK